MRLLRSWLQVVFPPICKSCKARAKDPLFCAPCWARCASPAPQERCPHCFEEGVGLCGRCKKEPLLPFAKAWVFDDDDPPRILAAQRPDVLASFAQMQWASLAWPEPDVLVPMPEAKEWAREWAAAADWPCAPLLTKRAMLWHCDAEAIEEGVTLLLLDVSSSEEDLQGACAALTQAFPKKGFILRLFP